MSRMYNIRFRFAAGRGSMRGVSASVDEGGFAGGVARRAYVRRGPTRSQQVNVRVSPGEREELAAAAGAAGGLSVGAYVGMVSLEAARARRPVRREVMAELAAAKLGVRRVGVNVNQIAAAVNAGEAVPAELAAVLEACRRAVLRVDAAASAVRAEVLGVRS